MLNGTEHNGTKVMKVVEMLLFLSPAKDKSAKTKASSSPDEIRNRVLLRIERAEIMSAMIAMRNLTESEEATKQ